MKGIELKELLGPLRVCETVCVCVFVCVAVYVCVCVSGLIDPVSFISLSWTRAVREA